jgi:hypothetical protein
VIDVLDGKASWTHVIVALLVVLGVSVLLSLETGKPVDVQGVTVDATSVLIMGGLCGTGFLWSNGIRCGRIWKRRRSGMFRCYGLLSGLT